MKQAFFSLFILIACGVMFSACTKQNVNSTPQPTMQAIVNTDTFRSPMVVVSTSQSQLSDTSETLIIKGEGIPGTGEEMILTVTNYENKTGVFSIVYGQATATYIHNGSIQSLAVQGIVAISRINSSTITGYFNFSTADFINVSKGTFLIDKP